MKSSSNKETIKKSIENLLALYNTCQFNRARTSASDLILRFPNVIIFHKILAACCLHDGYVSDALRSIKVAIRIAPHDCEIYNIFGKALWEQGELDEARKAYEFALKLRPRYPEALSNLAALLESTGHLEEAEEYLHTAIEIDGNLSGPHCNLGNVLFKLGRLEEAANAFKTAIDLDPTGADSYSNLGNILRLSGKLAESRSTLEKSIELRPTFPQAHNNLGITLEELGLFDQAFTSYTRAIALSPNYPEALSNLGNLLRASGQLTASERYLRRAIQIAPDYAVAHNNLGSTLKLVGQITEAKAEFIRAIEINEKYADAHNNLANVYLDHRDFSEALKRFHRAIELNPNNSAFKSNKLLAYNYMDTDVSHIAYKEACVYGDTISLSASQKLFNIDLTANRQIRIGFVSGDLRAHPIGFFLNDLLNALDKSIVSLYAFSNTPIEDEFSSRLRTHFEGWNSISQLSDFEAAKFIHSFNLDVLIDLSGHTAHNRLPLFAFRPAKKQASWLGYFSTTGIPEIDFFLSDPHLVDESNRQYFRERIVFLRNSWLCCDISKRVDPTEDAPCIPKGYFTFGNFSNSSKITSKCINAWARILQTSKDSRIFLKSHQFSDTCIQREFLSIFLSYGICSERVLLEPASSRDAYMSAYENVDLVLDTFPFCGGTTTVDALGAGVPVLTLRGDSFVGRLGSSFLSNSNLHDFVCTNLEDYIKLAIDLSADRVKFNERRRVFLGDRRSSALFDCKKFSQDFIGAMKEILAEK